VLVNHETVRVKMDGYNGAPAKPYVQFRPAAGDEETIIFQLKLDPQETLATRNSMLGGTWGDEESVGGYQVAASDEFETIDF